MMTTQRSSSRKGTETGTSSAWKNPPVERRTSSISSRARSLLPLYATTEPKPGRRVRRPGRTCDSGATARNVTTSNAADTRDRSRLDDLRRGPARGGPCMSAGRTPSSRALQQREGHVRAARSRAECPGNPRPSPRRGPCRPSGLVPHDPPCRQGVEHVFDDQLLRRVGLHEAEPGIPAVQLLEVALRASARPPGRQGSPGARSPRGGFELPHGISAPAPRVFRDTMSTAMSGGLTPGMRDAWPRETGRIRFSFSRASAETPGKAVPVEVRGDPLLLHAPEPPHLLLLAADVSLVLHPGLRQGEPRRVRGGKRLAPGARRRRA